MLKKEPEKPLEQDSNIRVGGRIHNGPREPFPTDPGAVIRFLVSTGGTADEQKKFIVFTAEQLRSDESLTEADIMARWRARQKPVS